MESDGILLVTMHTYIWLHISRVHMCTQISYRSTILKFGVHQLHILRRDRVHICTHFSIMLFTATSYFMIKHALKMIYLKYMHIKKKWVQNFTRFSTYFEYLMYSHKLRTYSHKLRTISDISFRYSIAHHTHTNSIYVFWINILDLVDMESNQWVWNFQWVWNVHMS